MKRISILDLHPAGFGLLTDDESFLNSVTDISENELKLITGGGSKKGSKKKSSVSYKNNCYCPCPPVVSPVPVPGGN